jgi:predicted glycoside hydrolase/deacetylase ChbG (UPF0249 family)
MSEPPARPIWLCADDYGISPAVNAAIRELILRRRINATSVMVVAPSFDRSEAAPLALLNAGAARVAIGLHVVLTAPFRPLSLGFAPVRDGAFLPLQEMFRKTSLRVLSRRRLEAEIAAQLQAFVAAFGRAPDFVDGHQHVHQFAQVGAALLKVVKQAAPDAWVRQCGRVSIPFRRRFADKKGLALDVLSRSFRRRAAALGIATNPAFAGTYDFAAGQAPDFATLFLGFLDRLPAGGLVMCHPGKVDAELERLDPLTVQREREYAYFAGESFPAVLKAHGVTLA